MIHTTIGVYPNEQFKMNGVPSDLLAAHIKYNIKHRPGRALFVDGYCIHSGYLSQEHCEAWEIRIGCMPDSYTAKKDTQPYQ